MSQLEINLRCNSIYASFSFSSITEKKKMNEELISFGLDPLPLPDMKNYYKRSNNRHVVEGNNWYW